MGQLGGASLSKCRELRAEGGSTRSFVATSQKTPLPVKTKLSRREPNSETAGRKPTASVRSPTRKAAGCRSAVGRVASRSVAPTTQILQKNHSLSMRCQNSDPAPQLLKSAHTRGTQAPSAPGFNRGRCRSWGANRNRRLGVFCDGLGMQLDPLCYSLCQIRGSALAVRPRFERDNRTVRFGYADVDCKDVPFLGAHKRPHSLAPIFLKQRQTQNRAGSSHIDPLLKKSS